jgi:hypothetical protein
MFARHGLPSKLPTIDEENATSTREAISVRIGHLSAAIRALFGEARIGFGVCAYFGWENCRRGIRHRDGEKRRAKSGVHESAESFIESKIQGVEGGVFGRRVDDWRYGYQSKRELFGHDDGGVEEHVV